MSNRLSQIQFGYRAVSAFCAVPALLISMRLYADDTITISNAKMDDAGFIVHYAQSPYQAGTTKIRVIDKLQIAHEHRDGPVCKHDWHSGWVAEAVELLLATP